MKKETDKFILIISLSVILFSTPASAEIIFNEIAWMGTSNSANDEWIELYNTSSAKINVTDWQIIAEDGSPSITLTGEIDPGGFYLLERTDDETVPGISADLIYVGALSNAGENIKLINKSGNIIQQINFSSGWPAGDSSTKDTMQFISGTWQTAKPTPRSANSNSSSNETEKLPNNNNENPAQTNKENVLNQKINDLNELSGKIIGPKHDTINSNTNFKLNIQRGDNNWSKGHVNWYFGDGNSTTEIAAWPANHRYQVPGEYLVVAEYYEEKWSVNPDLILRHNIVISEPDLELKSHENHLLITNNSNEIDLAGYQISDGINTFVLPNYLTIKAKSTYTVPSNLTENLNLEKVFILNDSGSIVAGIDTKEKINSITEIKSSNVKKVTFSKNKALQTAQVINYSSDTQTSQNEVLIEQESTKNEPVKKESNDEVIIAFIIFTIICASLIALFSRSKRSKTVNYDIEESN